VAPVARRPERSASDLRSHRIRRRPRSWACGGTHHRAVARL